MARTAHRTRLARATTASAFVVTMLGAGPVQGQTAGTPNDAAPAPRDLSASVTWTVVVENGPDETHGVVIGGRGNPASEGGMSPVLNDTFTYTIVDATQGVGGGVERTPLPNATLGLAAHALVASTNVLSSPTIYVHGGMSSFGEGSLPLGETHVMDVSKPQPNWTEVETTGDPAMRVAGHCAWYDIAVNAMFTMGGQYTDGTHLGLYSGVDYLSISATGATGEWHNLVPAVESNPWTGRDFHACTPVGQTPEGDQRVLTYGGRVFDENAGALTGANDMHLLTYTVIPGSPMSPPASRVP